MKRKSFTKMPGVKPAPEKLATPAVPIAAANGATKSFADYMTATFTRQLLDHAHRAKKAALRIKKEPAHFRK